MIIRLLLGVVVAMLLCYSSVSVAQTGVSVAMGTGTKNVRPYRVNLQRSWSNCCVTSNCRKVDGYWELAFSNIIGTKDFEYYTNKHLQATSLAAVVRIKEFLSSPFFVDIGIGLAYLSRQEISTRDLGSNMIFEERVGLGFLLGRTQSLECSYRLVHYSNGYLAKTNNALNLHLFILGYWFN